MKNNLTNNGLRCLISLLTLASVAFIFACQNNQVAEYRKYENDAEVPRISVEDAKKEADAGTAIIVDSRAETQYKQDHIAGSINIPLGSTEDKFSVLPKNKKIIVYCS
ncbi:MAG: rhodanese-like domain-containing protein [Pyrinomonadaceae bacterium]